MTARGCYSGGLHYLGDIVSDIRWFPSSFCESFETLRALARSNEGWRAFAALFDFVLAVGRLNRAGRGNVLAPRKRVQSAPHLRS